MVNHEPMSDSNMIQRTESGFALFLKEGETRLYDSVGNPVGLFTGEIKVSEGVSVNGDEVRLTFETEQLERPIRPTVGSLLLRADGHWQFPEKVLGRYITEGSLA